MKTPHQKYQRRMRVIRYIAAGTALIAIGTGGLDQELTVELLNALLR